MRIIKTAVPTGIIVILLLMVFGFSSTCACLSPDEDFAVYVGVNTPKDLNPQVVANGFSKHFPKGKELLVKDLYFLGETQESYMSGRSFVIDYWLESSQVAKKGYRIYFNLDKTLKVEKVQAAKVSSLFGYKTPVFRATDSCSN